MRDYYQVLGVNKSISQKELKKHYYKLAKKYHPDSVSNGNKKVAENRFKEISVAYNALSTAEKRRQYEQRGRVVHFGGMSGTYRTNNTTSRKTQIISKLRVGVNFSISSFARELNIRTENLEKFLNRYFKINNVKAKISQDSVIFHN